MIIFKSINSFMKLATSEESHPVVVA